jgi:hypothetical protein
MGGGAANRAQRVAGLMRLSDFWGQALDLGLEELASIPWLVRNCGETIEQALAT